MLGVFSSSSIEGTTCVAGSGFLCKGPVLKGTQLYVTLGQATGEDWSSVVFCIVPNGYIQPNSLGCPSGDPQASASDFVNGETGAFTFPSTPSYQYPTLGNIFSGHVYALYTIPSYQGTLVDQLATITAKNVGKPSTTSVGGVAYVPITITNTNTGAATPSPFQQEISFNPTTYALYENSNLGNIRFYQGSTELYSWCESGCTSGSGSAVFWVNLPSGIGAGSNVIVDMEFEPASTNYDGVYAGEAPQLSSTYAEYDNGASVFPALYQNFAGTSMPSGWTLAGSSIIINNGMSISASSNTVENYLYTTSNFGLDATQILDFYGKTSSSYGNHNHAWVQLGYVDLPNEGESLLLDGNPFTPTFANLDDGTTTQIGSTLSLSTFYVYSIYWDTTSDVKASTNYSTISTFSGSTASTAAEPIGVLTQPYQFMAAGPFYWLRIRTYPPSGIMPTASFGPVG